MNVYIKLSTVELLCAVIISRIVMWLYNVRFTARCVLAVKLRDCGHRGNDNIRHSCGQNARAAEFYGLLVSVSGHDLRN